MLEVELTTIRTALEKLCKKGDEIKSKTEDPAAQKEIDEFLNKLRSRMDDLDAQAKDKGQKIQVRRFLLGYKGVEHWLGQLKLFIKSGGTSWGTHKRPFIHHMNAAYYYILVVKSNFIWR